MALVFLGAGIAGAVVLSSGSGNDGPPATVTTLGSLRAAQEDLRDGDVTPNAIQDLTDTTSRLAAQVDDPTSVSGLQAAIQDQFALLSDITDRQVQQEVEQALEVTEDLAAKWDIELPRSTSTPSGTPAATPTASTRPTVSPAASPASSGAASPSVEP